VGLFYTAPEPTRGGSAVMKRRTHTDLSVKLEMLVERVLGGEAGVAVFTDVRPSLGVTCQVHLATHTGQPSLKLGVSVLCGVFTRNTRIARCQTCGGNMAQNCLKPTTPSRSTWVRTHGRCHSVGNQMVEVTTTTTPV